MRKILLEANAADSRWSPTGGIALLLAGMAILVLLTLAVAVQEPADAIVIEAAQCQRLEAGRPPPAEGVRSQLPFLEHVDTQDQSRSILCRFSLDIAQEEGNNLAFLIPSYSDSVVVRVNGEMILTSELHMMRNLRISSLPAFVPHLGEVLLAGTNTFNVAVSAMPGHALSLGKIYIGDVEGLRPFYHSRWLLSAVIPTVVVGGEIMLAVVFGLVWLARRRETEFGWIALTLLLAATRGTAIIPDFGLNSVERPFWNLLAVWETWAALMFCRALSPMRNRPGMWLLSAPAGLFTICSIIGPALQLMSGFLAGAMALVIFNLAASIIILAKAAWEGERDALVVMPGMVVLFAFVSHDIFVALNPDLSRVFLFPAIYGCFLLTFAVLMTLRFVRAMGKLDHIAVALNSRIVDVEEQLRKTYNELRIRREAEAIERERARLMRDLHDGIGGELATMLALADAEPPRSREIARHARAALTDMRLIIASLEDYGGDLPMALGAWKERAGPQLRATGLELIWQVRDVPLLINMGPSHVLDVLRIVQEAAANTMKHARASRLWIATSKTNNGIVLSICDDGIAFDRAHKGQGLTNMHIRARRLGARLVIERDHDRTCVRLYLPHILPAADGR